MIWYISWWGWCYTLWWGRYYIVFIGRFWWWRKNSSWISYWKQCSPLYSVIKIARALKLRYVCFLTVINSALSVTVSGVVLVGDGDLVVSESSNVAALTFWKDLLVSSSKFYKITEGIEGVASICINVFEASKLLGASGADELKFMTSLTMTHSEWLTLTCVTGPWAPDSNSSTPNDPCSPRGERFLSDDDWLELELGQSGPVTHSSQTLHTPTHHAQNSRTPIFR